MNLKGRVMFAVGNSPWDWRVSCVEMCPGLEQAETQNQNRVGAELAAGSEQRWVWAAQLEWHQLDTHKFWMCKRLHRNSEGVCLSLTPKCCPDFILSAFMILSWIKNDAKVCVAMLPCGRQPTPALLLCAHCCAGWMGHRKELLEYFCICPWQMQMSRPLCAGEHPSKQSAVRFSPVNRN